MGSAVMRCFPPFSLIPSFLSKLITDQAETVLSEPVLVPVPDVYSTGRRPFFFFFPEQL